MKNEIVEKLQKALNEEIKEEKQVIFILSKIRKLIELEEKKTRKYPYSYLKFYCNWAFHISLHKLQYVDDILKDFIDGKNDEFQKFDNFYKDLKAFLDFFNINSDNFFIEKNYISFLNLLIDVYSETPLIIKDLKKCIIINKSNIIIDGIKFSFSYRIINEEEFKY